MKRRITLVILLAGLALPLAPQAFAHDYAPRAVVVSDGYAVAYRRGIAPPWLYTHQPFQHWYHGSHYRYVHRLNWVQLYDLYRVEVRHSRPVRHYHRRGGEHDRYRHHRGRKHRNR
jgi:hypothetical protein